MVRSTDLKELLQTSSARRSVWWAGVRTAGTHLVEGYPDASLRQRPGRLRAGKASADDGGVHARATSSGSATTIRWPHLRQVRLSPSALLIFFSMPSQPQAGQVSGTGRFQVEKSHAG